MNDKPTASGDRARGPAEQITELSARTGALEASLAALQAAKEASDDRVFALNHRVAALERRERELQEVLGARREQVARLETERALLRDQLSDLSERANAAEARRDELERLRQPFEAVEARLRDAEAAKVAAEGARERTEQRHRQLLERVEKLQRSPSYRIMRSLWKVNSALRRPFRRRARSGGGAAAALEASAEEAPEPARLPSPSGALQGAGEPGTALASGGTAIPPETQGPSPARIVVDAERQRWLSRAAEGPIDARELRVGAIVDEISEACLAPECRLVTFGPDEWEERLDAHQPHFVLVESAWQGNSGSWQYQVASYDHPDYVTLPKLRSLISWCRDRGIPTAFWNKEDPVHFDRFKEAAALFDHVFTTDANCLAPYQQLERDGKGVVASLQFAAQPKLHNPIAPDGPRDDAPVFAGAYYRNRHLDRRKSLEMLLDAARPFGLIIYDRRHGSSDKTFGFPERFGRHIRGRLDYEQMLEAYKAHKLFLNVNSVVDSPTMFSRRVFELLASDTAVLSTGSLGIGQTFGELVPTVSTQEEATEAITRLTEDDRYRRELVVKGRRLVLDRHTYAHRLATVAEAIGYPATAYGGQRVGGIALVDDVEQARRVRGLVSAISSQSLLPAELLIGLGLQTSVAGDLGELTDRSDELRVRVVQQNAGAARSERYRELAALAASPWLAILHPQHEYGEHHLLDLLQSTRFANAEVIGSASYELTSGSGGLRPELEQRFTELVHPHSALAARGLVAERGWPDELPAAWDTLRGWFEQGVRFYSGDAGSFRADPALGPPPEALVASSEVG